MRNEFSTAFQSCSRNNSFEKKEAQLKEQKDKRLAKMHKAHSKVGEARLLMSAKRGNMLKVMGKKEQELERVLVEEVKVRRTDYASGCWVRAHVDKIVEHSDKVCFVVDLYLIILLQPQIAEVLVEMPDAHNGFQEVCHLLRRLQPLMRRNSTSWRPFA